MSLFSIINTPIKILGSVISVGAAIPAGLGMSKLTEWMPEDKPFSFLEGKKILGGWDDWGEEMKLMKLSDNEEGYFVVFFDGECEKGTDDKGVGGMPRDIQIWKYGSSGRIRCITFGKNGA